MATTENLYTGDGSTTLFSFTFPYIETTDVKVSLDGVDTTAFSLANATTVEMDVAPGVGVAIRVYRQTSIDAIQATFFPGSVIRAQDLNNNFEQTLYVVQESETLIANSDALTVAAIANAAEVTANAAANTAANAQTAADAAQATADQAILDAAAAQATADAAEGVANTAIQPSDSVGDLADVTVGTPNVGQALVWNGSVFSPSDVATSGATGGGSDLVFYENDLTVTTNYTLTSGKNAMTAGPITVNSGVTVTVPSGQTWTIV